MELKSYYKKHKNGNITIVGDYNTITGSNCTVIGNYNKVTGADSTVTGNHNNVSGMDCKVFGDYNNVNGMDSNVHGNHNNVSGMDCNVTGDKNKVSGMNSNVNGVDNIVTGMNSVCNGASVGVKQRISTFKIGNSTFNTYSTVSGIVKQRKSGGQIQNFLGCIVSGNQTDTLVQPKMSTVSIPDELNDEPSAPDNVNDKQLCSICMFRLKSTVIQDCGHNCMCVTCSRDFMLMDKDKEKKCPICRREIKIGIIRIYE
jgi:hypothetical protein